ncbi:hypothetical protein DH2020_047463 [Rehmannia glutinosa]|uniref:Pectinesterase inhibitor domain-containing protein n=1 Tax=Rehmannia glutinosa TaxID=99300 RepID=A0ABR0U8M8_REHGL
MSPSNLSMFIASIFLLSSMSNIIIITNARTTSSSSLIEKACSDPRLRPNSKFCVQVLRSHPKIVSATNLFDLSIAIMETGISSATNTRAYIENLLKKSNVEPNSKGALKECKSSYDSIILSFKSALSEVKYDKEYQTATYDLLIGSTDDIQRCLDNVASGKIKDRNILSGNKVVPIFGLSAYRAVDSI